MDKLEGERAELLKTMHAKHHTVQEVKDGVKALEFELTTRTLSSTQEAKMIKEIEQLKKTSGSAARFTKIQPQINEIKGEKSKLWTELKKVRDEDTVQQKKVEAIRAEMELSNAEKNEIKDQLDVLQAQIDKIDTVVDEMYAEKREKNETYWKSKYDHKLQREAIAHIEWMQRQKQRVLDQGAERDAIVAEREEAINDLPLPFFKEIGHCDALVSICNQLQIKSG